MISAFSVDNVSKSFSISYGEMNAVKNISFDVSPGSILALTGPNGAGKSTLIKMCLGLITPDSGSIYANGKDIRNNLDYLRMVGSMLDGNRNIFWRLSAMENIEYFAQLKGMRAKDARVKGISLLEKFSIKEKMSEVVSNLSKGTQQKISIICALIHNPSLIFFDEPTNGLDISSCEMFMDVVREYARNGSSIVIASHQLDFVHKISSDCINIDSGQISYRGNILDYLKTKNSFYEIELEKIISDEDVKIISSKIFGSMVSGRIVICEASNTNLESLLCMLQDNVVIKVSKVDFDNCVFSKMESVVKKGIGND